jgi:hypothetical protein
MPYNCADCPNVELQNICKEAEQWSSLKVIGCGWDEYSGGYIDLEQTVKVKNPHAGMISIKLAYRYFLDFKHGTSNYEGNLGRFSIRISDPEVFIDQLAQINNLGADILIIGTMIKKTALDLLNI